MHASVQNKKWVIKNTDCQKSLLSKLLENRSLLTEEETQRFFYPDAKRDFHDPFLMKGMENAVAKISKAIEQGQRIMIFGDYDVDGITGTAILMRTLAKLRANVSYRLPHRIEDGYGLREKFVREFGKLNVKILITVDNGISCFKEIELAKTLGIDVIITDHHAIPKNIPNAFAILHPRMPDSGYPFLDLTGAGVALKLAQALLIRRIQNPEKEIEKLLDLACMGTIADLGELKGENRFIVKEGLRTLEHTRWPGLSRLKEFAGVKGKIDTHDIGFFLSPRINAAGRISHPSHALNLLLHNSERTMALAENLENLNRKRQKMMAELFEIAEKMAEKQKNEPIIIISSKNFHGGIIGLIASKISEKYFRPAVVMEQRGDLFVGSCRSIPEINIVETLEAGKDLFINFGGHAAAAGFEIRQAKLAALEKKLKAHVKKLLPASKLMQPILPADCEISHSDICLKTIEILKLFEPFGIGNEVPRFLCKNIPIIEYSTVGSDKKHLKIRAKINNNPIDCIAFRLGQFAKILKNAKAINAICEIEKDTWQGKNKIQLKIVDFACAAAVPLQF